MEPERITNFSLESIQVGTRVGTTYHPFPASLGGLLVGIVVYKKDFTSYDKAYLLTFDEELFQKHEHVAHKGYLGTGRGISQYFGEERRYWWVRPYNIEFIENPKVFTDDEYEEIFI